MKHIDRLTVQQLNRLAAKAQWKLKKREFGDHYDTVDTVDYWIEKKKIWLSEYDPCHNGQQAMDLLKKYSIYLEPFWITSNNIPWIALCEKATEIDWQEATTPELAIVKAVVASKYGLEIDEGELE